MSALAIQPYQFGQSQALDPSVLNGMREDKRKAWSVRRRIEALARKTIELAPGEEVTRDKLLDVLSDNRKWPISVADVTAAVRFARALNGSDLALQAVVEDIDGKLKDVIEHQVKPLDLTDDERAERMAMILAHAQKRIADQGVIVDTAVDSQHDDATDKG